VCMTMPAANAATRLKDITRLEGDYQIPIIGYGLMVGLDGTGDKKGTQFTNRSLVNMLQRMGVTVDANAVKVKNVAAVIVTAQVSPLSKVGGTVDVTVSSLGDATSLQGGMLLLTPLSGPDGVVYASAQGPITIGGFNVQAGGTQIRNNYSLVGRIPSGGLVQTAPPRMALPVSYASFILQEPDVTTATRIVSAINRRFGEVASAIDAATVHVTMPPDHDASMSFLARLEAVTVVPDVEARVVLNEKTGTIVSGSHVSVAPVALAHGALTVEISSSPIIVQPLPFSGGETAFSSQSDISVQEESAKVVAFDEVASVGEMAAALNAIGATPRDVIAIFQALREAGALRARLIIM
jgi:flagellar P-ring protein precursor FlgI